MTYKNDGFIENLIKVPAPLKGSLLSLIAEQILVRKLHKIMCL